MNDSAGKEKINHVLTNAKSVIYGQDDLLDSIMAALVCEGHILIEGMPGLGKTLSVATMAKLCDLSFKRIQFTPDLLPSDLIGTMIYSQRTEQFTTKFGPIFTQLLLADEINRSPAKVQAALLEAMAEKQVTIGENTHKLTSPFVVMATQNPIEQEGTYPLPEAQLDRFMMKVSVNYPAFDAEKNILSLSFENVQKNEAIMSSDDIFDLKTKVNNVYVDEKVKDMIVRVTHATRPGSQYFDKAYEGAIIAGASPRATIWLYKLGKFMAFMRGRDYVTPEDVLHVVPGVLGHRVILSYEAMVDKIQSRELCLKIAESVV